MFMFFCSFPSSFRFVNVCLCVCVLLFCRILLGFVVFFSHCLLDTGLKLSACFRQTFFCIHNVTRFIFRMKKKGTKTLHNNNNTNLFCRQWRKKKEAARANHYYLFPSKYISYTYICSKTENFEVHFLSKTQSQSSEWERDGTAEIVKNTANLFFSFFILLSLVHRYGKR